MGVSMTKNTIYEIQKESNRRAYDLTLAKARIEYLEKALTQTKQETIQACIDALPEKRPDAVKQGEIIPFDGKNKIEMHWLRKCQDAGFNEYADTAHTALNELKED